jgi:hypothetical protein
MLHSSWWLPSYSCILFVRSFHVVLLRYRYGSGCAVTKSTLTWTQDACSGGHMAAPAVSVRWIATPPVCLPAGNSAIVRCCADTIGADRDLHDTGVDLATPPPVAAPTGKASSCTCIAGGAPVCSGLLFTYVSLLANLTYAAVSPLGHYPRSRTSCTNCAPPPSDECACTHELCHTSHAHPCLTVLYSTLMPPLHATGTKVLVMPPAQGRQHTFQGSVQSVVLVDVQLM